MKTFDKFVEEHKDESFRYWVHKRMFTPYEQEQKFEDESTLENIECSFGYIVEAVELPNGDILLGLSEDKDGRYKSYYKLSDIDLALSSKDNE